jgi:hypothetical protein
MKRKKLNVKHLWIQFEDFLLPRLRLSITDRAVYSHLIRHSRLEGRLELRFSMPWLARGIGISTGPVRESVRRLVVLGALRLIRRSKLGHVIHVLLPDEIRGLRSGLPPSGGLPATLSRHSFTPSFEGPLATALHPPTSKPSTSSRPAPCASPSTSANAAIVSIVCAAPTPASSASTTSCPASSPATTPIATWFLPASNAIPSKASVPPPIVSAGSTASAA